MECSHGKRSGQFFSQRHFNTAYFLYYIFFLEPISFPNQAISPDTQSDMEFGLSAVVTHEHKISVTLWKYMYLINSRCESRFLEGFPQQM